MQTGPGVPAFAVAKKTAVELGRPLIASTAAGHLQMMESLGLDIGRAHDRQRPQRHHLAGEPGQPRTVVAWWCNTGTVEDPFGWDEVAAAYASRFSRELEAKPFDRKLLEWFVERAGPVGPICDLGCGPGQVAAYVRSLGIATCGIDLSTEMVHHAAFQRGHYPTWVEAQTDRAYIFATKR